MLRVFLTIVLPLALPTGIYVAWLVIVQRVQRDGAIRWERQPWLWLAAAGVLLLGLVLYVVTVHFGTSQSGTYVPPRWENGRVLPGHIEPRP